MDVTVRAGDFAREMALAARVAARKPTIPTTACVRLEARGSALEMGATDLDISVRAEARATVAAEGVAVLNAQRLADLARTWPDDADVRLSTDGSSVAVVAPGFRSKLAALPADDFPTLPQPPDGAMVVTLPRKALLDSIRRVRYAITSDDKRYFLDGARLEVEPRKLQLVAADSRRLVVVASAREDTATAEAAIMPRKLLDAIAPLLDDAEDVSVNYINGDAHLHFGIGRRRLSCRTVDGKFPAYARIVPPAIENRATVPTAQFMAAVKRALLVTDATDRRVSLALDASGLVVSTSSAAGDTSEHCPATYAGDAVRVPVKGAYVVDFVDAVAAESVEVEFRPSPGATTWRATAEGLSCLYVLMPLVD